MDRDQVTIKAMTVVKWAILAFILVVAIAGIALEIYEGSGWIARSQVVRS